MKKIIWVASYPKSGNTWVRAILSSLFYTKEGKFDLNLLKYIVNFDIPDNYEFVRSLNINDFNTLEQLAIICKYWSIAQRRFKTSKKFTFFKTHSGNVTINKFQYTNPSNVLGVVYIIRDPRDVVISYSKHYSMSINDAIKSITSPNLITWSGAPKNKFYRVLVSNWDIHYKTWNMLDVPKLVIKYETLLTETKKTLNQIVKFFIENYGYNFNNIETKIHNIIKTTSFEQLQGIEKKQGFIEAPYFHSKNKKTEFFFRKGINNQWKKELTQSQIKKIETPFETTMKELGYIK